MRPSGPTWIDVHLYESLVSIQTGVRLDESSEVGQGYHACRNTRTMSVPIPQVTKVESEGCTADALNPDVILTAEKGFDLLFVHSEDLGDSKLRRALDTFITESVRVSQGKDCDVF